MTHQRTACGRRMVGGNCGEIERQCWECRAIDNAIPDPISPEVDTGCNGPTSVVRQQLFDAALSAIDKCQSDGLLPAETCVVVVDAILAEFHVTKR